MCIIIPIFFTDYPKAYAVMKLFNFSLNFNFFEHFQRLNI